MRAARPFIVGAGRTTLLKRRVRAKCPAIKISTRPPICSCIAMIAVWNRNPPRNHVTIRQAFYRQQYGMVWAVWIIASQATGARHRAKASSSASSPPGTAARCPIAPDRPRIEFDASRCKCASPAALDGARADGQPQAPHTPFECGLSRTPTRTRRQRSTTHVASRSTNQWAPGMGAPCMFWPLAIDPSTSRFEPVRDDRGRAQVPSHDDETGLFAILISAGAASAAARGRCSAPPFLRAPTACGWGKFVSSVVAMRGGGGVSSSALRCLRATNHCDHRAAPTSSGSGSAAAAAVPPPRRGRRRTVHHSPPRWFGP